MTNLFKTTVGIALVVTPWFALAPETFWQRLVAGAVVWAWALILLVVGLYYRPKGEVVTDRGAVKTPEGEAAILNALRSNPGRVKEALKETEQDRKDREARELMRWNGEDITGLE